MTDRAFTPQEEEQSRSRFMRDKTRAYCVVTGEKFYASLAMLESSLHDPNVLFEQLRDSALTQRLDQSLEAVRRRFTCNALTRALHMLNGDHRPHKIPVPTVAPYQTLYETRSSQ